MSELELIRTTAKCVFDMYRRPSQVNQKQGAEMLHISEQTMSKMVRDGRIKLNDCGMIPITEIDRVLGV